MARLDNSSRRAARRHGRAFTLIELLVVIAVIMILAAMAVPTFVTAQRSAFTANCKSNLRQIAQALFTYGHDNGMMLPCRATGGVSDDDLSPLFPRYAAEILVFRCPASQYDFPKTVTNLEKKTSAGGELSYEYPGEFVISLARKVETHYALLAYDDDGRGVNVQTDVDAHSPEGGNMSFVDGRVEWVKALDWYYAVYDGIYAWANPPRRATRPE